LNVNVNRLLTNICRGDTDALEALYRGLKDEVYRFALSILMDTGAAEDVLQETFVRAFALAYTHKPGMNGRAWIFSIARNLCLDRLRAAKRASKLMQESDDDLPDRSSLDFIEDIELREALASLAEDSRRILLLRLAHGFKFKEIAECLCLKQSAAEWKYYSAIRQLSKHYEGVPLKGVGLNEAKN
jgi:RNA polymerase sigma-70 factor (ECF subfamily)